MGFRLEPPRSDVQTLFGDGRWSDDVPLCPSREDSKGPLYQEPHWSVDAFLTADERHFPDEQKNLVREQKQSWCVVQGRFNTVR